MAVAEQADRGDITAGEEAQVEREGRAIAGERQTLFSDAVIAIAITLLALELPVPEGTTSSALWHAAVADRAEYLAFGISFLVIWARWSGHHRVFRYVTGFDSRLGALNSFWLFLQVVVPFAAKVIGGEGAVPARFGFYALIQAASSITFGLMVLHIRRAGLYRRAAPAEVLKFGLLRSWILAFAFLVSIPLFLVSSYSWIAWIAIPVAAEVVLRLRSRHS